VTDFLAELEVRRFDRAFLCGNARMITEVLPILVDKGLCEARIHTETYF
jgi:ferredoxin-NADP reductase